MRLATLCVVLSGSLSLPALADPAVVDGGAFFPEGPVVTRTAPCSMPNMPVRT